MRIQSVKNDNVSFRAKIDLYTGEARLTFGEALKLTRIKELGLPSSASWADIRAAENSMKHPPQIKMAAPVVRNAVDSGTGLRGAIGAIGEMIIKIL